MRSSRAPLVACALLSGCVVLLVGCSSSSDSAAVAASSGAPSGAVPSDEPAPGDVYPGSNPQCPVSRFDPGVPSSFVDGSPVRDRTGSGMRVHGVVLEGATCAPVVGARVHVWHEGPSGGYLDRFRSVVVTDEQGRFRYSGPALRVSAEAEPHLHFLVESDEGQFPFTSGVPELAEGEKVQRVKVEVVLPPVPADIPAV